jgi:hypothetical protein
MNASDADVTWITDILVEIGYLPDRRITGLTVFKAEVILKIASRIQEGSLT